MLRILNAKRQLRKLANDWRMWSERIANAAEKVTGPCELYVFGSVAENHATGASDVDILVVCNQLPKTSKSRGDLKAKIEEEAGLPPCHPFEIHLTDRSEASLYFRHIKQMIKLG